MASLLDEFNATVRSATLVQPVDAALIEAGRTIAGQIDWASENATGQDLTKALYLMPHLVNILREMLATPLSRHANGVGGSATGGSKLAQLRASKGRVA